MLDIGKYATISHGCYGRSRQLIQRYKSKWLVFNLQFAHVLREHFVEITFPETNIVAP